MRVSACSYIFLFSFLFGIVINPIYSLKQNEPFMSENEEENEENTSVVSPPVFSLESGYYDTEEVKELEISSNDTIYYTLDSTDPKTSDTAKIYTKSIEMYDRSIEENVYSKVKHEEDSPYSITLKTSYTPVQIPFDKLTVVKAVSQNDKGEFSETITKVYVVMDSDKLKFYSSVPIISIVTEPENLFGKDIGILVCGQQYIDWKNSDQYDPNKGEFDRTTPANFYMKGKEWEREATITFFESGKLGFSQNMGIRMKGSATRGTIDKAFNVFSRKEYQGRKGKLKYDLFEDNFSYNDGRKVKKYDSFGIRTIYWWARIKENFLHQRIKLFKNVASFSNKRCTLFINGEYWGDSDIVERSSSYYFLTNFGIPEENILIVKNFERKEGEKFETNEPLEKLHHFCVDNDLSIKENYEKFCEEIDIDSLIEYFSIGLYIGVWDWPNYNFLVWKNKGEKIEGNTYSDGKWRFGSFDFDITIGVNQQGMEGAEDYAFDYFTKIEKDKGWYPTSMFFALLDNSEFRQKFAKFFTTLPEDIFEPNKMEELITENEEKYSEHLALTYWRWWDATGKEDIPRERFVNDVLTHKNPRDFGRFREFFRKRPEYAIQQMKTHLNIE